MTTWHILATAPRREMMAIDRLRAMGVDAFAPMERRWARRRKYDKRKHPILVTMFPSYVFAGFDCEPRFVPWSVMADWTDARERRIVHGGIGMHGRASIIPPDVIERVRALDGLDLTPQTIARALRPGQLAEITCGPYVGNIVPIAAVTGKRAHVLLHILGGERRVQVRVEDLVAA